MSHTVYDYAGKVNLNTNDNAPIKSKLQHPRPPRANPGHLTIFCARGVGNLTGKAFPGVGNLTFAWGGEN